MTFNPIIMDSELTLPREWDKMNDDLMVEDEELSATSNEEASKVFAQWKADDDIDEIMEVDQQIGSNLLDEAIFDTPCLSPTGPLEEIVYMNFEDEDDKFLALPLTESGSFSKTSSSKGLEEQYRQSIKKLAESMKRSQETRKSLIMKTPKTKKYSRSSNVSGVLSSIEESTKQLQLYLEKNQRNM